MKPISFLKMQGLGNDFVLIDERHGEEVPELLKPQFAIRSCDRHKGIGADGVLFVGPSGNGVSFRIFNADGSEAETCVNGLRCVSLALRLRLDPNAPDQIQISTQAGTVKTKILKLDNELEGTVEVLTDIEPKYGGRRRMAAGGRSLVYHLVNVGNPHAVAFLKEDVRSIDVEGIGHALEHSEYFKPEGVNTEFVNMISTGRLRMRVHERGACETQACGSGAIAAAAAARQMEPNQTDWLVEMPGGSLEISFKRGTMIAGPAALAFEGITYL